MDDNQAQLVGRRMWVHALICIRICICMHVCWLHGDLPRTWVVGGYQTLLVYAQADLNVVVVLGR